MRYAQFEPPPDLAAWIDRVWSLQSLDGGGPEPVLPDGCPELVLNFGDSFEHLQGGAFRRQPAALLVGQLTGPLVLRPTGTIDVLAIRLRPEGAAALFGARMPEVVDDWTAIADLPCCLGSASHERLAGARDAATRARLAFRLLRELPKAEPDPGLAAACAGAHVPGARVDDLARAAGTSVRTLERRFRRVVGIGPKRLLRIYRFQRVVRARYRGAQQIAAAALDAGYFDQAHFLRDFRDFAGTSPRRFFNHGKAELAELMAVGRQRRLSCSSNPAMGQPG